MSTILLLLAMMQPLVMPRNAKVEIAGYPYQVTFEEHVYGPVRRGDILYMVGAASRMNCPDLPQPGEIAVSSALPMLAQAKAIIHETVHIAQDCDWRTLPLDERIAEDVSDILQSPIGPFLVRELGQ